MSSERVFTNDGVIIAKVMRDHLNTWHKKPADFMLEDLGKKAPSIMLQQLASAEKRRVYINGSYIGVWSFAVYMRVNAKDTASRLDAIACLTELSEWFQKTNSVNDYINLPHIDDNRKATKIEMTSNPTLAARYDDGTEDYQAFFTLEYQVRRT